MNRKTYLKNYYIENKEKYQKSQKAYYETNKEKIKEKRKSYPSYQVNYHKKGQNDINRKKRLLELKTQVLEHYGTECACCGESHIILLGVDHINNDGKETRSKSGKYRLRGESLYRFLIQNGFPEGIQILCFNCNIGRQNNGGECPHSS